MEQEQLERALELKPDLVTLVCGANDVLVQHRPDPEAYAASLSRMFARLRRELPHVQIVTATYPDISRFLELRPRTQARVVEGMERFNEAVRRVAPRHDVVLIESFDHPLATEREIYAADGFHPSAEGHRQRGARIPARDSKALSPAQRSVSPAATAQELGGLFALGFRELAVGERFATRRARRSPRRTSSSSPP